MKFKIDENLPAEFVGLLVTAGHDAVTVKAQELQGKADSLVIAACSREDRSLVTQDLDFADIRAYPPEQYPGLIVLRLSRQDKLYLIEVFQRAIRLLNLEPLLGRLWIIEDARLRIRGGDEGIPL